MLTYAITGVAGYVAPRHLEAIKQCGGKVVAALDICDSVGILDSYNRACEFSKNTQEFFKLCMLLQPEYLVICAPNYYHYDQAIAGLRITADVICEKPVVLTTTDIKRLRDCEASTGKRIYTILQSRLKPELQKLREAISNNHKVSLKYHTPRGKWYHVSWKSNTRLSGGLATNIGIHTFDLLLWLFGQEFAGLKLTTKDGENVVGRFSTPKAEIEFDLSIAPHNGVCREITIDGEVLNFTGGFTDLHTQSYQEILVGRGFTLTDAEPSITLCEKIRRL